MLTITIQKTELKKAFFSGIAEFLQELNAEGETGERLDTILLKTMLENYKPKPKRR